MAASLTETSVSRLRSADREQFNSLPPKLVIVNALFVPKVFLKFSILLHSA